MCAEEVFKNQEIILSFFYNRKINAEDLKRRRVVAMARKKLLEDKEAVTSQIDKEVREAFMQSKLKSSLSHVHAMDDVEDAQRQ